MFVFKLDVLTHAHRLRAVARMIGSSENLVMQAAAGCEHETSLSRCNTAPISPDVIAAVPIFRILRQWPMKMDPRSISHYAGTQLATSLIYVASCPPNPCRI